LSVRLLPENLINQIAAGEVVERPASVVKELLENAIDAQSTRIAIHLKSGGRAMIRIIDNGIGMNRDDALMSLERHATSKIRNLEDLVNVASLGFRGEAVPAIASVSRFQMLTRRPEDELGTEISFEGGILRDVRDAGCPSGTEILVRSLFYNIPARRKFLRTTKTELSHCVDVVTRSALVHHEIDFELLHDGRTLLRASKAPDALERAKQLLGATASRLIPLEVSQGPYTLRGFVSPVGIHRSTARGASYLYVNGRHVKDPVIRKGVNEAYRGLVPKGRYPVIILEVLLDPSMVDVNAHPAKVEVRFRDARALIEVITESVRGALRGQGIHRPLPKPTPASTQPVSLVPAHPEDAKNTLKEPSAPVGLFANSETTLSLTPSFEEKLATPQTAPTRPLPAPSVDGLPPVVVPVSQNAANAEAQPGLVLPVARFVDLRVIGQLSDTYIICEGAGKLVLIDQHAAHERVTLDKLLRNSAHHLGEAQVLLTPVVVNLSRARAAKLAANMSTLDTLKITATQLDPSTFAVTAVPAFLGKVDLDLLLSDLADESDIDLEKSSANDIVEKFLSTMACHSSVRANHKLNESEVMGLLRDLDAVAFQVCAHGRPVVLTIGSAEIERRFHRS
jgi:DNA mismatch repair protein MutL